MSLNLNWLSKFLQSSLDLSQVRIDESSHVGTHNGKYAYVSFYYINCKGMLQLPRTTHEIVPPFCNMNRMDHPMPLEI